VLHGKKIVVVMPAYNAAQTLVATHRDIPHDFVDEVILVDDGSADNTAEISRDLGITTIVHAENRGYGANQKTCYRAAIASKADVVAMLHPDYQYDPRLLLAMISMIIDGPFDVVIGSRILGGEARRRGMPLWKYTANRSLTMIQNLLLGAHLSEYHTGYRAFSRRVLEALPFERNDDDFAFDNEILAQIHLKGFLIGELSCPAKYFPEASSINFRRSVEYGFGVLRVSLLGFLHRAGLFSSKLFR
jgi:glycosyltransferase involved in cell wall biosynthesis